MLIENKQLSKKKNSKYTAICLVVLQNSSSICVTYINSSSL